MPLAVLPKDFRQGDTFDASNIWTLWSYFKTLVETTQLDAVNFRKQSITEVSIADNAIDNADYIQSRSIPSTAFDDYSIGDLEVATGTILERNIKWTALYMRVWRYTGVATISTTVYKTDLSHFPNWIMISSQSTSNRHIIQFAGGFEQPGTGTHNWANDNLGDSTSGGDGVTSSSIVAGGFIVSNNQDLNQTTEKQNALVIIALNTTGVYPSG